MRPPASTFSLGPNIPAQTVLQRELGEHCSVRAKEGRCDGDKAVDMFSRHLPERSLEILGRSHRHRKDLNPEPWAAAARASMAGRVDGAVDTARTPTRFIRGSPYFMISSCLVTSSVMSTDSPVMLPPGRARLTT